MKGEGAAATYIALYVDDLFMEVSMSTMQQQVHMQPYKGDPSTVTGEIADFPHCGSMRCLLLLQSRRR